jgi:hypothetical protein
LGLRVPQGRERPQAIPEMLFLMMESATPRGLTLQMPAAILAVRSATFVRDALERKIWMEQSQTSPMAALYEAPLQARSFYARVIFRYYFLGCFVDES